jgi:hypothetical protein
MADLRNTTKVEMTNRFFSSESGQGVRIVPFTTETDSLGLEENVEVLSDKQLLNSAWDEVRKFYRFDRKEERYVPKVSFARGIPENMRLEIEAEAMQLFEDLTGPDEETGKYKSGYPMSLMQGCSKDIKAEVGEPMHPYWVTWSQGDEAVSFDEDMVVSTMNGDRRDEIMPEPKDMVRVKLEPTNWVHLRRMEEMRELLTEWFKVSIKSAFDMKSMARLEHLDKLLNTKRDESFQMKLLSHLENIPANVPLWRRRDHFLKLELQRSLRAKGVAFDPNEHLTKRERKVYFMYTESRKLTFKQHKELKILVARAIKLLSENQEWQEEQVKITMEPFVLKLDLDKIEREWILVKYEQAIDKLDYYRRVWSDAKKARDHEFMAWAMEQGMLLKAEIEKFEKKHNVSEADLLGR